MDERSLRQTMCAVGRRLWERGLIGASEGNFTARVSDDRLLCTPSGVSKGHMAPEDLLLVDLEGNPIQRGSPNLARSPRADPALRPSSEITVHLRVLQRRPDCHAVVHAHPPVATGFSAAGRPIPDGVLPESAAVLGPVALVPFAMPGTDDVPNGIEPFLSSHKTFLLSHHGAVTLGADLWAAAERMETLERVARIVLTAELLGGARSLPQGALERLYERFPPGELG
jgi:L-fuculose-phosphate aldolase